MRFFRLRPNFFLAVHRSRIMLYPEHLVQVVLCAQVVLVSTPMADFEVLSSSKGQDMLIHAYHSWTRKNVLQNGTVVWCCTGRNAHKCGAILRTQVDAEGNMARVSIHTPTHTNTHQHTPTHTNTHQHTPTHTNTHQHTPTHPNTQQHTPTHTNTHQHTPTHTNTHQHTPTHTNTGAVRVGAVRVGAVRVGVVHTIGLTRNGLTRIGLTRIGLTRTGLSPARIFEIGLNRIGLTRIGLSRARA